MDNECIRAICMAMPHVTETLNWGHYLVYWVGDRDIGGRMFASTDVDGSGVGVLSFHCGAERFHELLEIEGMRPTPYSAKQFWVTLERWGALPTREIEKELKRSHALIYDKLPPKTKKVLALPDAERKRIIRERKKVVAEKAKTAKAQSR